MNLSEHPLLSEHAGKPAILDANLLILYWCSQFNPALVKTFKRLKRFDPNDVMLLSEILRTFGSLSTTPHVLTETSNLANSLQYWIKSEWSAFFSKQIQIIPEIYTPASEIATDRTAINFGITDAALVRLASEYVVLTVDWPLTNLLESRGKNIVNFNHIREAVLLS